MARYVPIGSPVNAVEAEGIRRLRDELPDHYTVIGNFELQLQHRRNTLEFDAVVIGEYGIWAVEIKGWGGRITGDVRRWNLEWGPVENPLIWIELKAKALRHFLSKHMDAYPQELFCESVVILPLKPELDLQDPRRDKVVNGDQIRTYFDDRDRIYAQGPGPLIDVEVRDRLLGAITPVARERSFSVDVSGYEVEAELTRKGFPYREFVGRHKMLRSRSRVRIKRFEMDPLQPAAQREQNYNRVLRDMEALGQLEQNPYVARAYEVIQDRDNALVFYLVSEWIGPSTLESAIADLETNAGAIDPYRFAAHLIRAVSYMHDQGIIHRRLNPRVVFLSPAHEVPLKIADFDYSRIADLPTIASDLHELGAIGYTAPEIWMEQREDYDHRMDLYPVGVMIAEVLLNRRLFPTLNCMRKHVEVWQQARTDLEPDVAELLDVFLESNPDNRCPDLTLAVNLFERRANNI